MAGQKVKCPICEEKKDKIEMIRDGNKRYYCKNECWDKFLRDKEFREKERDQMNDLMETVSSIHRLTNKSFIPSNFYPYIQELRNDSVLFGKVQRKYKEGISYKMIEEAYLYCDKKIEQAKQKIPFKDVLGELKYGLAIVRNNIENMIRDKKKNIKNQSDFNDLVIRNQSMKTSNAIIKEKQSIVRAEDNNKVDLTTLFD